MPRFPCTTALALSTLLTLTAASAQTTPAASAARIKAHMEVVGVDGAHVGTVDTVEGTRIVLAKTDPDAGGEHHAIPIAWVGTVDGKVLLTKPAADAKAGWEKAGRPGDDPRT